MDLDALAQAWRSRRQAEQAERDAWSGRMREKAKLAARVLVEELGAREVWLFGSLVWGRPHPGSDVDLAVRGVSPSLHYAALARASEVLGAHTDLVDLDACPTTLRDRILADGVRLHG